MTCEHPVQQFIAEDGRVHAWMPSFAWTVMDGRKPGAMGAQLRIV